MFRTHGQGSGPEPVSTRVGRRRPTAAPTATTTATPAAATPPASAATTTSVRRVSLAPAAVLFQFGALEVGFLLVLDCTAGERGWLTDDSCVLQASHAHELLYHFLRFFNRQAAGN